MKSNVQKLQLTEENKEELKKKPWFLQMGVCFQIAPKLDHCKECKKVSWKGAVHKRRPSCFYYSDPPLKPP